MDDRELLELAAKAAGIERSRFFPWCFLRPNASHMEWNPLDDDGDALRLAVRLRMNIEVTDQTVYAGSAGSFAERKMPDEMAATRRAIVRAAAEIGRSMP